MKKTYKKPVMKSHKVNYNYDLMGFIPVSDSEGEGDVKQRNNNDFDDKAWEEY